MAVNINGDTGIDKVQPGTIDSADFGPGSVTAPAIASGAVTSAKLDTNLSIPGTMTATSFVGSGASLTGIAGGFSNMDVFTSPGTWTNPGNVQKVKVTVVGGGGTGGTANGGGGAGGGGGGGSAIEIIPFPSGTNVPISVGGASGTSSFGAYCSATGGSGGSSGTGVQGGGNGGTGSGGQINMSGQKGSAGTNIQIPSDQTGFSGGQGGGSLMSPGGYYLAAATPGNPLKGTPAERAGVSYGGGGSGGYYNSNNPANPNKPGGAGAAGIVIVEY